MNILGLFLIFNTLLFIIAFGISLAIILYVKNDEEGNLETFFNNLDTNPNYLFREVSDIVFGIDIEHILFGAVVILVSLYYYT